MCSFFFFYCAFVFSLIFCFSFVLVVISFFFFEDWEGGRFAFFFLFGGLSGDGCVVAVAVRTFFLFLTSGKRKRESWSTFSVVIRNRRTLTFLHFCGFTEVDLHVLLFQRKLFDTHTVVQQLLFATTVRSYMCSFFFRFLLFHVHSDFTSIGLAVVKIKTIKKMCLVFFFLGFFACFRGSDCWEKKKVLLTCGFLRGFAENCVPLSAWIFADVTVEYYSIVTAETLYFFSSP